jgi:hypothetical protein
LTAQVASNAATTAIRLTDTINSELLRRWSPWVAVRAGLGRDPDDATVGAATVDAAGLDPGPVAPAEVATRAWTSWGGWAGVGDGDPAVDAVGGGGEGAGGVDLLDGVGVGFGFSGSMSAVAASLTPTAV